MNDSDLAAELKSGSLSGMYFFYGEEDYLKNRRNAEIRRAVVGDDPDSAAFNVFDIAFGDGELDTSLITDALLAPPMMAPRKFISVSFTDLESLGDKKKSALLDELSEYAPSMEDSVLVLRVSADGFDAGTDKKPSAFLSAAGKFMKCVEFACQSPARLTRWMERHFAEYGLTLPPESAERILSLCGRSMYRLIGEIEKTAAYTAAHGSKTVSAEDIAACVSRIDEDDAFRLANCLLNGDAAGALESLNIRVRRREDPILLLSQITRVFCDLSAASAFAADGREKSDFARSLKMHEYKAGLYWRAARQKSPETFAAIMDACCDADRAVKLGGGYGAIEQLIGIAAALGEAT